MVNLLQQLCHIYILLCQCHAHVYIYIVVCGGSSGNHNRQKRARRAVSIGVCIRTVPTKTKSVTLKIIKQTAGMTELIAVFPDHLFVKYRTCMEKLSMQTGLIWTKSMDAAALCAAGLILQGCVCFQTYYPSLARLHIVRAVVVRVQTDGLRALCIEPINLHGRRCSLAEVCLLHAVSELGRDDTPTKHKVLLGRGGYICVITAENQTHGYRWE